MPDAEEPEDPLARLERRVEAARSRDAPNERQPANFSGMALGYRIAAEFAASIAVGAVFGLGADWGLGTSPFGLILGVFLGFAAGVLGILRAAGRYNEKASKGEARKD